MSSDATDHYADEIVYSSLNRKFLELNYALMETRQPVYVAGDFYSYCERPGLFYRLALPLSNDDEQVDMILVGFCLELDGRSGAANMPL